MNISIIEDEINYSNNIREYFSLNKGNVLAQSLNVKDFLKYSDTKIVDTEIVILDVNLADGESGIDGIKPIKKRLPKAEVVVLTSHDDSKTIFEALCNGASGYLTKGMTLKEIYANVEDVYNGGSCMTPSIARKVVSYFNNSTVPVTANSKFDSLTARELEVVEGIKDGLSYKMIAGNMEVSVETVRFHVKNIYRKLHVNSKSEVISAYYRK